MATSTHQQQRFEQLGCQLDTLDGTNLLIGIVDLLASLPEVDLASIARPAKNDPFSVEIVASTRSLDSSFPQATPGMTFSLADSPYAETAVRGHLAITEGCKERFGINSFVSAMQPDGYIGIALVTAAGTAGVLELWSASPLGCAENLRDLLSPISGRLASALLSHGDEVCVQNENFMLRALLNAVPYPVFCKNHEGRYLECNHAAEKVLGMKRSQLLRKTMRDVAPKNLISSCYSTEHQIASGKLHEVCHEGPLPLPDGSQRKFRFYKSAIPQKNSPFKAVACSFLDITDEQLAYERIAEKQNFLQSVIDNVVDPIMVVGLDKQILLLNRQARVDVPDDILQCETIYCRNVCHVVSAVCKGGTDPCPVEAVLEDGHKTTMLQKLATSKSDDYELHETVAAPYLVDEHLTGVVVWSRNVSERASMLTKLYQQEQRLQFLAYHDYLTSLPNRLLLQERLHHALGKSRRENTLCALLFVDLDRFKVINDSLGHDIGDLALKAIADRLSKIIRETDTIARFGGDEFLILLESVKDINQVTVVARKILNQFAEPIRVRDLELFTTASIGICTAPDDGIDAESLIKNAEVAMYRGKNDGRNTYTYYNRTMDCLAHEQFEQERRLRIALEKDEMQLHYQPQFDLASNRIIGFEALVRWMHPERGEIGPNNFIPIAEETGLIVPLSEWCIEQACKFICRLKELGMHDFRVAVNVSPRHFRQKGLTEFIQHVLGTTGADPSCLELEITEGTIMEDVRTCSEVMTKLSDMGIGLAIDDFGTGYSSLNYLKKFPVNKLKIDQSFVAEIQSEQSDATLIKAIISLAESMGLNAIAEGVEIPLQLETLLKLGCTQAQGFLFSKALPEENALNLCREETTLH